MLRCEVLRELQCGYLLLHGPPHGLQGNTCFTMISPLAAGNLCSFSAPSSPTSFFSHVGAHRAVSHFFFLIPLSTM